QTAVVILVLLFATIAYAGHSRHCGMCISERSPDGPITSCDQLEVTIDDRDAVRAEEIVPVAGARSLTIRAPEAGGIRVVGAAANYSVTACKAAAFDEDLRDIHV